MASATAESHPDLHVDTFTRLDPRVMRAISEIAKRLRDAPKHPHLVQVRSADRIGDVWTIVSEHVDGVPLADVFFRLSLGARLRVVVDVLAALSALHTMTGAPVIHGGVLLRVAFIDKNGRTKLGNAYAQPLCMKKDSYAPESLLGDEAAIDARTDVYGAGVLLWEAVTGQELFGIDAPEEIVKKQLAGKIAKAHAPARDRWVTTVLPVIDRALSVNPADRYATIAEMAAALRIAVRARLMMYEDLIEEIWPAATMRKLQSGVQPAAEPIVAEAAMQVVLTPSTPLTVSTIVPLEPVPEEPSAAPAPRRRPRALKSFALAVLAAAFVVVLVVVSVVRVRSHTVAARADATPEDLPIQQPALTPHVPVVESVQDVKPVQAPAAATPTVTAPPVHKAKTKASPYNPSSI